VEKNMRVFWRCGAAVAFGSSVFLMLSCGPSEEEILVAELQEDLTKANTTIDSLNYTVESSNMLIDDMRSRVDSLQRVDTKLLQSVQRLNKAVKKWRDLARDHKRKNEQLTAEIQNLKREKQADRQTIAKLRRQAESLNATLLDAHTSIRRQEDQIRRMEVDLVGAQEDAVALLQAQTSVRVYAATEPFLRENGYLKSSRAFRRGFRKSFKMTKKPEPNDPAVKLVKVGETLMLEGELKALVDRYGSLKKGDDYKLDRSEGMAILTFSNEMLGGVDVLAIMKE
jgi:myosin heavy subunit